MTIDPETTDELEFDQSDLNGDEDAEIPADRRRVYTEQADPEIDSLFGRWKRGRLDIQPDFQRQFVWDSVKSSRLIESALLDIPIPIIYLSEESPTSLAVIDGQQRLTAFFSFIDGRFPDNRPFKLTGLKVLRELNGKLFADLEEALQDKVKFCSIRTITFGRESDPDLKFEIFERLNSGAVALNEQELRNCVYRGPYNAKLRQLAQNSDFRDLLGLAGPDKRMRDVALVLRFAAFYHATYLNYRPPMTRFLNADMAQHQRISPAQANELEAAFKNALGSIKSLLHDHAFKRYYRGTPSMPGGRWEPKKFNASLYDVLMFTFARADRNRVMRHLDLIREAFIHLMTTDDDFIAAIELSTSSLDAVTRRFDKWRRTLEDIIGPGREPRLFSRQLKQELYDADPTCELCGQHIVNLDDAAVDHIEQYWRGGPTVPSNGRLTHRYCNWSRPRNN